MPQTFEMSPRGPFDLAHQQQHFGWTGRVRAEPSARGDVLPGRGVGGVGRGGAAPARADGAISGEVHGCDGALAQRAWEQALAVLSLDVDGAGFPAVGERDPVIGPRAARRTLHLRPTLFHSPYEAACNFVIGQRISMAQARALRLRMAAESGDSVDGRRRRAPRVPATAAAPRADATVRGLPEEKLARLHGIARAALDGVLDRARLRALPVPRRARRASSSLRGVGPFSAQGIVFRGAGVVDEVTDEPVSKEAVQRLYELDHLPDHAEVRTHRAGLAAVPHVVDGAAARVGARRGGRPPAPRHGRRRARGAPGG